MRRERRSSTYVQILKELFVAGKAVISLSPDGATVTSWDPAWGKGLASTASRVRILERIFVRWQQR
jgi:hypothetical protein